jgi:hypothetical protein
MSTLTKVSVSLRGRAILAGLVAGPTDAAGLVERGAIKTSADATAYIGSSRPHKSGGLTYEYWDAKAIDPAYSGWNVVTLKGKGLVESTKGRIDGRAREVEIFRLTAKGRKLAKSLGLTS